MTVNVLIHTTNKIDIKPFASYELARYFVKNNISYSGWNINRVEIVDYDGSTFAAWDKSWDDISKTAGIKNL